MKRSISLLIFLCCGLSVLNAQRRHTDTLRHPALRIKGTLFDFSYFSLPYAGAGVEFDISDQWTLDVGAGYVYNSVDEDVNAQGFRLHTKFNQSLNERWNNRSAVSLGVYYTHAFLDDYLLHEKTLQGSVYNEYIKRKYSKQRYGFTVEWINQFRMPDTNWFFELDAGLMLSNYATLVPSGVTQRDFRNGWFYARQKVAPSPIFKVKFGHMIWGKYGK